MASDTAAMTLHSISFIIHAYYNGGGCITSGASGKKAIAASIQDKLARARHKSNVPLVLSFLE